MNKFKTMDDMIKFLVKNSTQIMQEIIDEEIIPTMLEVIDEKVYRAYKPKVYERRYEHGGLADPTNFDSTIDIYDNTIEISVKNITMPKDDSEYVFLDTIIVNGCKNLPMKRDYYEATREVLRDELPNIITKKFKEHGIDVKFKVKIR